MARTAHFIAVGLVLAAAVIWTSMAAASPTITTLAGGGSQTPIYYDQSGEVQGPDANLPAPKGIAWAGDPSGIFYVVPTGTAAGASNPQCVLEWFEPDAGKDTGFLGMWGGAYEDCGALGQGYYGAVGCPCGAKYTKLDHPTSVAAPPVFDPDTNNTTFGPLVSSRNTGYVNFYSWWANTGVTTAGSTKEPNCGGDPAPAYPDNVDPTTAHFCTLTAIAFRQAPRYDWLAAESGREAGADYIYQVAETGAATRVVFPIAHTEPVTAVAWDDDPNFIPLWPDSTSAVWRRIGGTKQLFAGNPGQPGFAGDGGPAVGAKLNHPQGLAPGFDGSLYIADTDNCRIRHKTKGPIADVTVATISTVAGNGCSSAPAPYGDGGSATDANLDHPAGIAMAPTGLLISDTGHNRVRLLDRTTITSAPTVTKSTSPSFTVESLDSPAHLKCTLDGGAPADCTSPVVLPSVSEGSHTFKVWENGTADDGSGPDPPDPTPAVANFKVDTTPPSGLSLTDPAPGADNVPVSTTFKWAAGVDGGAGIDHYELWIDGARSRDVAVDACSAGACTAQPVAPLTEGAHRWQVIAIDKATNAASSETRDFTAGAAPAAAFSMSPNPALVGRAVSFDAHASSDDGSIARYQWDLDGDGSFETDGGASPTTSRTYTAPATVSIGLRVTDGTGKTGTATQSLKITATGSQSLLGISINSGAQYTRARKVKLLVKAPALASAVLVSNDGGFLVPQTFPVAASVPWTLDSSGPERLPKTVYVRFMLGPIISETYTDDIILDEIPPVVQQVGVAGAASAGPAVVQAAKATKWIVKVKARDSNSGVSGVQVTANKRKPGKLLKYKRTLKVAAAKKPKFVRAR